jgi:hypothetical protein
MVSEEEEDGAISQLQDAWRNEIARYLSTQFTTASLSDIAVTVKRPVGLPSQTSLATLLQDDPLQRFAISGEGTSMRARRIFRVDDEEIREYVEEWRNSLAEYLSMQSATVGLSDIGSNVARPSKLPTSVKLIDVLKSDEQNRFNVSGEGNSIRAKFNFNLNEGQIAAYVEQWREQISRFLSTQSTTVGLSDIGSHVQRPFCLQNSFKLLDILQNDPLDRFAVSGDGSGMRARRIFRVDDKEIVEYVEEWRRAIACYLATQYSTVSLSDIGSNANRPSRLPTSVKLIDVMRSDPVNRFALTGDGNNIRAELTAYSRPHRAGVTNEPGAFGVGFNGTPGGMIGRDSPKPSNVNFNVSDMSSGNSSPGRYRGSAFLNGNQVGIPPLGNGMVGMKLSSPMGTTGLVSPKMYPHGQYLSSPSALQQQPPLHSPSIQQSNLLGGTQVPFPSPISTPSSMTLQSRSRSKYPMNFSSPYDGGSTDGNANWWPPASPHSNGLVSPHSNGLPQSQPSPSDSLGLPLGNPKPLGIDTSDMALGIGGSNPVTRRAAGGNSMGGSTNGFSPRDPSILGFGVSPISSMSGQMSPRQASEMNFGFGGMPGMVESPGEQSLDMRGISGGPNSTTAGRLNIPRTLPSNDMTLGIATPNNSRFGSEEAGSFADEEISMQAMHAVGGMHQGLKTLSNGFESLSLSSSREVGMPMPPPVEVVSFSGRQSLVSSPATSPGKGHIPDEYVCPISHTIMKDPVLCADGLTYDRLSIEEWMMKSSRSPVLGTELQSAALIPNTTLQLTIQNFQQRSMLTRKSILNFGENATQAPVLKPSVYIQTSVDDLPEGDLALPRKERIASDSDPVLPIGCESPHSKSPVKCPKLWSKDTVGDWPIQHTESLESRILGNRIPSGTPMNSSRSGMNLETDRFEPSGEMPSLLPAFSPDGIFGERTILSPAASPYQSVGPWKAVSSIDINTSRDATDAEGSATPEGYSNGSSLSELTEETSHVLSLWLPEVFAGFDNAVVQGFVEKLRDEAGFISAKDLLEAQMKGQLTHELLYNVAGFKLGHYNRLLTGLASLSRSDHERLNR